MLLFGHSRVSEHALVDAINMPRFNALYSGSIYLNLLRAFKLMDTLFSLPANSQNKLVGRSPMMIFTLDFACSDRHYPHVGFTPVLWKGKFGQHIGLHAYLTEKPSNCAAYVFANGVVLQVKWNKRSGRTRNISRSVKISMPITHQTFQFPCSRTIQNPTPGTLHAPQTSGKGEKIKKSGSELIQV